MIFNNLDLLDFCIAIKLFGVCINSVEKPLVDFRR